MRSTYLTKSRFKMALECMTQLYYSGKKDEYADKNLDDEFLEALAKGGYQVGELAKYYFIDDPVKEKITIETLDFEMALKETEERLKQPGKVVIAEAAFKYKDLFIRVDMLVREGNIINIYEVKAKSIDPETTSFLNAKGTAVLSGWIEYVYDIAFQRFVVENALRGRNIKVKANLMLVNKGAVTNIDGLHQFFKVFAEDKRKKVVVKEGLRQDDLGNQLLIAIPMDDVCDQIENEFSVPTDFQDNISFKDFIWKASEIYKNNIQVFTQVGSKCKMCPYYTDGNDLTLLKSGFNECWQTAAGSKSLEKPLVIELWNGLAGNRSFTDELVRNKKYFLETVEENDIAAKKESKKVKTGLTPHERRLEQINRVKTGSNESYFDSEGLEREMDTWTYPLHLIDFETSAVAIPFFKGLRPYSGIAFQFSHHTINKDWTVKHTNQFISFQPGIYPNFDFADKLMESLSNDDGTIFRYHNHENTYLIMILRQLQNHSGAPENKNDIIDFFKSITHDKDEKRKGRRDMVDLYDLVLRFYYPPSARGSNSLKKILPAIIQDSEYLRWKYGRKGVYGKNKEMNSLNFEDHVWINQETKNNPYKTLPKVFEQYDPKTLDLLVKDFEDIADGGAALTAYNYLQFSNIPLEQREKIRESLLRYCELDTLAMAMLLEGWKQMPKMI